LGEVPEGEKGLTSQIELNHILSNSFGFGGANTTLIIKRV